MKNPSLLVAIFLVILYSCSKKKDANTTPIDTKLKYTVSFLPNVHVAQYKDTTFTIPISPQYTSGNTEPVSVTLKSYPNWVSPAQLSSLVTPGDIAIFPLKFRPFAAGIYTMAFTTKSSSSDTQYHSFNVVVVESSDCSPYLIGNYTSTNICRPNSVGIYPGVIASTGTNRIKIGELHAQIDCKKKSITIPTQFGISKYYEYEGLGTFTPDTIFLRIIRTDIDMPFYLRDTCDFTMVRK